MRLVSDALYSKLFSNVEGDPASYLADEKNGILNDKTIPIEMKSQMYHQSVRNVHDKLKEEASKPMPISHEWMDEDMPTPDEVNKKKLLDFWLTINDVVEKNGGLYIDKVSSTGKLQPIKDWLLGEKVGKPPASFNKVFLKMSNAGLPRNFFEVPQKGRGIKCPNAKKVPLVKKGKKKRINVQWKPY